MEQDKKKETSLDRLVKMLKGQKTRSEAHELIVILHDKPDRSPDDNKKYQVLIKAELAKVAAKKAATAAANMLGEVKAEERKARNHRLILIGTAAEKRLQAHELKSMMDAHLVSDADRELFGLGKNHEQQFCNRYENKP